MLDTLSRKLRTPIAIIDPNADTLVDANETFKTWFEPHIEKPLALLGEAGITAEKLCKATPERPVKGKAQALGRKRRPFESELQIWPYGDDDNPLLVLEASDQRKVAETQAMLKAFSETIDKNNRMIRRAKKAQDELLDNMKQAVFAVNQTGKIVKPISKYSESIFDQDIVGQTINDVLFQFLDTDEQTKVESAFELVFAGDSLQWDIVADEFPPRIQLGSGASSKILRVSYSPIWETEDEDDLEKVLLVAEDVTDVERLLQAAQREKSQRLADLETAEVLVSTDRNLMNGFFEQAHDTLDAARCGQTPNDEVMRGLHTVKGNARSLSFHQVVDAAHHAETHFGSEQSKDTLDALGEQVAAVERLAERFFGSANSGDLPDANGISSLEEALLQKDHAALILEAQKFVLSRVDKAWDGLFGVAQEIAQSLGKQIELSSRAEDVYVTRKFIQEARGWLNHLVRNGLDHGLETPEERIEAGKNPVGSLSIEARMAGGFIEIKIVDDGRGVSAQALAKKMGTEAVEDSDDAMLNILCGSGFSTKSEVTDLSGRGVGLDAVRSRVEKWGGQLKMKTAVGKGTQFVITLPCEGVTMYDKPTSLAAG